jgi:hypothetical protein
VSHALSHPILRATAHRQVPQWVHELALARASEYRWAGRNDCPTHVANGLLERAISAFSNDDSWSTKHDLYNLTTRLATRGDLDLPALADAAQDDTLRAIVLSVAAGTLSHDVLVVEASAYDRSYERYAKYLAQLNNAKKPLSMTACEWMSGRYWAFDTLVSKLAYNVTELGNNKRLLRALQQVSANSQMGSRDLGYLCAHDGDHSILNERCLYSALGQYDAHEMLMRAPAWAVGWLDALTPEARSIAMAVLESGSKGTSFQSVTDAATAVAGV